MALMPLTLQQSWQELQIFPLSLLLLFSSLYVFKRIRNGKQNLPPSPPKLPIIGHLHHLGILPHRSLHALSKKYGPIMFLYLGHTPTLVVSSADMAKDMVKTHDFVFSNRPPITAAKILFYGSRDVAFSPYCEYWRQARKNCVLELLSLKRVQSFQYVREAEVEELVNKIHDSCLKKASVNLSEMLIETSNKIITRCVLGQKYEEDGDNEFGQVSKRLTAAFSSLCLGDFFPYLGWIDVLTGVIPSLKAISKEVDSFLDQVVQRHKTMKSEDDQADNTGFVNILLQLQKDGMPDFDLTQENIKAILLDMFVAGIDTTSTALEWAMAELIKNPHIMKRAQEEVRGAVGNKSKIDVHDINRMDYLKCIINETLRLHPPLPLLLPRETSASVRFGGYDIPAKTRVCINAWAIQRDPAVWERPEEFLPERFKDNPVDFRGQYYEFLPFGGGRRGCPGITFSVASVEYVIANLLCWFDWGMPSVGVRGQDLDMSDGHGLTVPKKSPLHLLPTLPAP